MRAALLLVALLLAGCATTPPPATIDPEAGWRLHAERVSAIVAWDIDGRLSLKTPEESARLGMSWRQSAEDFDLRLSAAFGQGVVRMHGDAGEVTLELPEGERLVERSAERLLLRYYGWDLPVASLRYWIRGIPQPDVPAQQVLDDSGRLASLQQGRWRVSYREYTSVDGMDLPRRLRVESPGYELRMVVDSWRPRSG